MRSVTFSSVLILAVVFCPTEAFRQSVRKSCIGSGQSGCNPNAGILCCGNKICAKGNSYPGTCVDKQGIFGKPSGTCIATGKRGCDPKRGRNCCAGKICARGTCVDEVKRFSDK